MQKISISAQKSQQFSVQLEGVTCTIKIHQRTSGLYMDAMVGDMALLQGVICLNCNPIVRYPHLRAKTGFKGDLFFSDTQGSDDPEWSELGDRFVLYYLTQDEIS